MVQAELAAKRVIRRDFDLDEVIEQLLGPLWHRICVLRAPVKEGYSVQQARYALRVYSTL